MKDQIKQAFKAGWLANHQGKNMPDNYLDRIVDNAFKQWKQGIVKKPLSELTEHDAIALAEIATEISGWSYDGLYLNAHCLTVEISGKKNHFSIDFGFCLKFSEEGEMYSLFPQKINAAAATDKARELGYDI